MQVRHREKGERARGPSVGMTTVYERDVDGAFRPREGPTGRNGRASKEEGGRGRAPADSPFGVKNAASDPFPMFWRGMFEALRHRERCPMTPCVT